MLEILLVEDNPGDVRLTQEALKAAEIQSNLSVATDGVQALKILNRDNGYEDKPLPDIVLLDLNLPRKSGHEVLRDMKSNDALRKIPVIVLSTSQASEDISNSYGNYANCFISKPVDFDSYTKVIGSVLGFWADVVRLPSRNSTVDEW